MGRFYGAVVRAGAIWVTPSTRRALTRMMIRFHSRFGFHSPFRFPKRKFRIGTTAVHTVVGVHKKQTIEQTI